MIASTVISVVIWILQKVLEVLLPDLVTRTVEWVWGKKTRAKIVNKVAKTVVRWDTKGRTIEEIASIGRRKKRDSGINGCATKKENEADNKKEGS